MTLLAEAMKGLKRGLHSSSDALFGCLLHNVSSGNGSGRKVKVLLGVLTSVIHHTDEDGFKPILNVILKYANEAVIGQYKLVGLLIFTAAGVRKGSRIAEAQWRMVIEDRKSVG